MKKLLFLPAILALSACQTTKAIPVTCVSPEQVQALREAMPPKVRDSLTGDAQKDLRIIAASSVRLRDYAEGLLEILEGCSK